MNPFRSAALTEAELEPLRRFSCRDAQCYQASDRGALLQIIHDEWVGGAEAFDLYVQTELPPIFAESKRQYHLLLTKLLLQNLRHLSGDRA
jgi:hypothetical protein